MFIKLPNNYPLKEAKKINHSSIFNNYTCDDGITITQSITIYINRPSQSNYKKFSVISIKYSFKKYKFVQNIQKGTKPL